MRRIGVLALQGAVSEHIRMAERCDIRGAPVKNRKDLDQVDALVIPGGESTAISGLIRQNDLAEAVREFAKSRPVLGTCAGLVICSKNIAGQVVGAAGPGGELRPLGLMDITVERNGFGRQVDSFETKLEVTDVGTIPAVFIRAPFIREAGPGVKTLASIDGKIVMAEQGAVLVTAFHPELTDDLSVFSYFAAKFC